MDKRQNLDSVIPFFMELPFFKNLNLKKKESEDLIEALKLERFKKRDIVMEIGSHGEKFYIILEGTVSVYIKNMADTSKISDEFERSNSLNSLVLTEVAQLQAGKSFGELALTDNKFAKRKATIKSLTSVVLAVLHKVDYDRILSKKVFKRN